MHKIQSRIIKTNVQGDTINYMKLKKITIKDHTEYYFLSDGIHILSLGSNQWDKERFDVSSVHKPSARVGTGFKLIDSIGVEEVNADLWNKYAHIWTPNWATVTDRDHTVKYKDLNEWIAYEENFYAKQDIHISEIELQETEKPYAIENRKQAILRAIYKIQNFMDCDVLGEANEQIAEAQTKEEIIPAIEYALSAISYRKNDRKEMEIQQLYTTQTAIITNLLAELKE